VRGSRIEHKARRRPVIRRVRTPEGQEYYDQPIGSIIVRDWDLPSELRGLGGSNRSMIVPNRPAEVDMRSFAREPKKVRPKPPEGVNEVETDSANTRKFKIGRRSFYTFKGPDGQWHLHDPNSKSLGTAATEEELLPQMKQFLKKITRSRPTKFGRVEADEAYMQSVEDTWGIKVPPAYRDSALHADVDDPLNHEPPIYWIDRNGKEQPKYTHLHHERANRQKFQRSRDFIEELPVLDAHLDANWSKNEAHGALFLIRKTGMRPSSPTGNSTGDQTSFGATTLQARHVKFNDDGTVELTFPGKSKKNLHFLYDDPDLVAMLRHFAQGKSGTQRIFGEVLDDKKLNALLKSIVGNQYKVKDLRTVLATSMAQELVEAEAAPENKTQYKKLKNKIADEVSEVLGNTRSMALGSYIDPEVWLDWEKEIEL
jgi:DNA topoisomerase I